jgi:hypothetical protein
MWTLDVKPVFGCVSDKNPGKILCLPEKFIQNLIEDTSQRASPVILEFAAIV